MKSFEEVQAALQDNGWKSVNSGPFMALTGPLWSKKETAGWAYGILSTEKHLNPAGLVHGGLLQTLMDHALSTLAWEAANRSACVTVQLSTQFLATVREGCLIEARGHVARHTSSLMFMQGALSVAGHEVMAAQAIMKILAS